MTKNGWKGRRVLVTGGSGLIGSGVAHYLQSLGAHVSAVCRGVKLHAPASAECHERCEWITGDLTDEKFCHDLIQDVDHVLHLASFRRNVAYHLEHREEVIEKNLRITECLAEALTKEDRPIPVTYFSTALLGALDPETAVDDVKDGYMAAKMLCERHWYQTCADRQSPLLIVRPVSVYGPGDSFGEHANVIPSLIKKCMESTDALTVWGSGDQRRSFLYSSDVPTALMKLLDQSVTGLAYLCPPETVTIRELATLIRDIVRPGLPIEFDTTKPDGPTFPELPVHPLLKSFSWTPLGKGLQKTISLVTKSARRISTRDDTLGIR